MAGAPSNLSSIINKYTEHKSCCICERTFPNKDLNKLYWNYDYIHPTDNILQEKIEWSDIIHFHNKPTFRNIKTYHKKTCLQFHSQPEHHGTYIPYQTYKEFNNKKLVVGNYQTRYYTDAIIVPNMIDIWDELYTPEIKDKDTISIIFSYAWEQINSWSDKGSRFIIPILEKLQKEFSNVKTYCITNTPFNELMKIKKTCDIVIDDIITGAAHLSSFEGLSVGSVVFNNIDIYTKQTISSLSSPDIPFIKSSPSTLYNYLQCCCRDIQHCKQNGINNREWIEKHFDPKKLVDYYIKFYNTL
jgi:hypothetical protein